MQMGLSLRRARLTAIVSHTTFGPSAKAAWSSPDRPARDTPGCVTGGPRNIDTSRRPLCEGNPHGGTSVSQPPCHRERGGRSVPRIPFKRCVVISLLVDLRQLRLLRLLRQTSRWLRHRSSAASVTSVLRMFHQGHVEWVHREDAIHPERLPATGSAPHHQSSWTGSIDLRGTWVWLSLATC